MEDGIESKNFLKCQYQNIAEVVNLKCEKCHEKLKHLLKSLSAYHLNAHNEDSEDKSTQVKLTESYKKDLKAEISIAEEAVTLEDENSISDEADKQESVTHIELPHFNEYGMSQTSERTEIQKDRALKLFKDFIQTEFLTTFETALKDKTKLEEYLILFFHKFRVKGDQLPKKHTLDCNRSFLKTVIFKSSYSSLDISNNYQFPKFNHFYKNYTEKLRSENPANPEPIPEAAKAKIYKFLSCLHGIMNGTSNDFSRIPKDYENKYHFLARDGMMFLLMNHFRVKRKEKMIEWIKSDFEIVDHPDLGQCYKRKDSDKDYMPFNENEYGLNVGQYFKDYMTKLDANSPWILTKPKINYRAKHGLQVKDVWYEETRIGKNRVFTGLSEFFAALDLPQYKISQIVSLVDLKVSKNDQEHFEVDEDPLASPVGKKIKLEVDDEMSEDESNFVFIKSEPS